MCIRDRCHSLRQYRQISKSVPGRCLMSVAPHLGQWLAPSFSSSAAVSMATGSGAKISSRRGLGSVAGSMGELPGNGGTSRGEPGPVGIGGGEPALLGGSGGGGVALDMVMARWVAYRPVSYTHLDVYKRQVRHRSPVWPRPWFRVQTRGIYRYCDSTDTSTSTAQQHRPCLLYTSRCV